MTRSPNRRPALAANDNAPLGAAAENMAHVFSGSHVYMLNPAEPAAGPAPKAKVAKRAPLVIATDLPECFPILPEEIALIRGYMSDLVSRILANDNEPT